MDASLLPKKKEPAARAGRHGLNVLFTTINWNQVNDIHQLRAGRNPG